MLLVINYFIIAVKAQNINPVGTVYRSLLNPCWVLGKRQTSGCKYETGETIGNGGRTRYFKVYVPTLGIIEWVYVSGPGCEQKVRLKYRGGWEPGTFTCTRDSSGLIVLKNLQKNEVFKMPWGG